MKKLEYCLLQRVTQEKDKKNRLHYWVVSLFTNEGLVEILKSESWMERHDDFSTDYSAAKSNNTQRAIMISRLGLEGWEWVEGDFLHVTFKRSKDE
jgi:hypothetical protein